MTSASPRTARRCTWCRIWPPPDPNATPLSAVYTFSTSSTAAAKLVTTGTYITDVAVNRAGTRVYVNDADEGTIRVFDASNKLVDTIHVTPQTLGNLTFNGDGTLLFAVDTVANSVLVFDTTANHAQIASVQTGATTTGYYPGTGLSPDGREFYYSSDTGLRVVTVLPVTNASTPGRAGRECHRGRLRYPLPGDGGC